MLTLKLLALVATFLLLFKIAQLVFGAVRAQRRSGQGHWWQHGELSVLLYVWRNRLRGMVRR